MTWNMAFISHLEEEDIGFEGRRGINAALRKARMR
jgi:hypothetical protein